MKTKRRYSQIMKETQRGARAFCSNYDCNFFTDEKCQQVIKDGEVTIIYDDRASVIHQIAHPLADPAIICTHEPFCNSLYMHYEKSPYK